MQTNFHSLDKSACSRNGVGHQFASRPLRLSRFKAKFGFPRTLSKGIPSKQTQNCFQFQSATIEVLSKCLPLWHRSVSQSGQMEAVVANIESFLQSNQCTPLNLANLRLQREHEWIQNDEAYSVCKIKLVYFVILQLLALI